MFKIHPLTFTAYTAVADHLYEVSGDLLEIAFEAHRDAPYVTDTEADYEAEVAHADKYITEGNDAFNAACRFGWQEAMDYKLPTRVMSEERRLQVASALYPRCTAEAALFHARFDTADDIPF